MDLAIATSVTAFIAIAVLLVSSSRLRRQPKHASLILSVAVLAAAAFLFTLKDRLLWASIFPSSAAIIYANVTPILLMLAAGGALHMADRPLWRRAAFAGVLIIFAAAALFQPIFQPIMRPVRGYDIWTSGDVCQQSTPVTCSPAAAATLLKAHAIDSDERTLVETCLTDKAGTPSLGLWRGLRLATDGTDWKPMPINAPVDELIEKGPWPCLLLVGFPRFAEPDPLYTAQYGWAPGFRHSVVLFGPHADGGLDMGDPSIGRERWDIKDLQTLWLGEGIYLSKR